MTPRTEYECCGIQAQQRFRSSDGAHELCRCCASGRYREASYKRRFDRRDLRCGTGAGILLRRRAEYLRPRKRPHSSQKRSRALAWKVPASIATRGFPRRLPCLPPRGARIASRFSLRSVAILVPRPVEVRLGVLSWSAERVRWRTAILTQPAGSIMPPPMRHKRNHPQQQQKHHQRHAQNHQQIPAARLRFPRRCLALHDRKPILIILCAPSQGAPCRLRLGKKGELARTCGVRASARQLANSRTRDVRASARQLANPRRARQRTPTGETANSRTH